MLALAGWLHFPDDVRFQAAADVDQARPDSAFVHGRGTRRPHLRHVRRQTDQEDEGQYMNIDFIDGATRVKKCKKK